MMKVYLTGLKIWARVQSFVEIVEFTQPVLLNFGLMWGSNKVLPNLKNPRSWNMLAFDVFEGRIWVHFEVGFILFIFWSEYRMPEASEREICI